MDKEKNQHIIDRAITIKKDDPSISDLDLLHSIFITMPINVALHLTHTKTNEVLLEAGIVSSKYEEPKNIQIDGSAETMNFMTDLTFDILTKGLESGKENSGELIELLSSTFTVYETLTTISTQFIKIVDVFIGNDNTDDNENPSESLDEMSSEEISRRITFDETFTKLMEKKWEGR